MMNTTKHTSLNTYAKIAGLLYLLIAICGGFSMGYIPSIIIEPGDATKTAQNIMNNRGLFQLGILGDVAVVLMEIILTVLLYQLFKSVNQTFSMIAAYSRIGMTIIMGVNLVNNVIPLQLLNGAKSLSIFEPQQLDTTVMLFVDSHQFLVYIWGIFFGLHLIFLGYLIFKSAYVPKIMGVLMMIGSFGYSIEGLVKILFIDVEIISMIISGLLVIAVIGELSFTFWLLIKGVKINK